MKTIFYYNDSDEAVIQEEFTPRSFINRTFGIKALEPKLSSSRLPLSNILIEIAHSNLFRAHIEYYDVKRKTISFKAPIGPIKYIFP